MNIKKNRKRSRPCARRRKNTTGRETKFSGRAPRPESYKILAVPSGAGSKRKMIIERGWAEANYEENHKKRNNLLKENLLK